MNIYKTFRIIFVTLFVNGLTNAQPIYKFAVIGDFGNDNQAEADVAALVNSWDVNFIVSVGDNYYGATDGNYADSWQAIDLEVGKYYQNWIKPYLGSYGSGSPDINRFFPALGNHDWYHLDSSKIYEDYFDLTPYNATSGTERYYDFVWGNAHYFVLSTYGNGLTEYTFPRHNNYGEPDGVVQNSIQALWLKTQLENANPAHWKIIVTHHPPYSSGIQHGSESAVRWPFKDWGANLVLCGHDHNYERLRSNNLTYIVNGLGGESIYSFGSPIPESQFRYNDDYGAMLFEVYNDSINAKFITRTNLLIDQFTIIKDVIPVELISFTAEPYINSAHLKWVTATETNNAGFEIHRNDGSGFRNINFIMGNGTTSEPSTYNFVDNNLHPGIYEYRLKQLDLNGNFEYSNIVNLSILDLLGYSISQNYPNPFNPSTTISYKIPEAMNVSLKIFDILGNEIITLFNEIKPAGLNNFEFSSLTGNYSLLSGIYFYEIKAGSYTETKKMIFLK